MPFTDRVARQDWLLSIKIALMISIGAVLTFTLAVVVEAALRESVTVPIEVGAGGVTDLPDGTSLVDGAAVEVRMDSATWAQSVLHALTQVPTGAVAVWVFLLLLRVVNDARRGNPFNRGTVRRLRTVGVVLLLAGTATDVVEFLAAFMLSATLDSGVIAATYYFTGMWILGGVGALAVAEVVNRAYHMRAELDEVI